MKNLGVPVVQNGANALRVVSYGQQHNQSLVDVLLTNDVRNGCDMK